MSRFNSKTTTPVARKATPGTSAVKTKKSGKTIPTGNGATGYERTRKGELFLLAVANFVGQDTFYEDAKSRDNRFSKLSRDVALRDPEWFAKFVNWLRNDAFMRTASIVAAVEGAKAIIDGGSKDQAAYPRQIVRAAISRADEPGELLGYYFQQYVGNTRDGKSIPFAFKKAIGDAVRDKYNEYSLLKYDTASHSIRFGDVLSLVRPQAKDPRQNDLFKYALDRRYGKEEEIPSTLRVLTSRQRLNQNTAAQRRDLIESAEGREHLKAAGFTWEALSGWLQGPMDAKAWEAIIPSMGYMALLRNLRNFDQAGISDESKDFVIAKLQDPDEVSNSKQFPFRFLSAYQANKNSLTWASALERALQLSLSNVPALTGRTLILVDRSGSMYTTHGGTSDLTRADTAALFGSALALRAEDATLVEFGTTSREIDTARRRSVLRLMDQFTSLGGTNTVQALQQHYNGHERVILVTDEQYGYGYGYGYGSYRTPSEVVPATVPMYTWNLAGYAAAQSESNQYRHTFGGLTDKGFQMIPLIEAGQNQTWPWESNS